MASLHFPQVVAFLNSCHLKHFSSHLRPVEDEQFTVLGGRIFTSVVLANQMSRHRNAPANADNDNSHEPQNFRMDLLTMWLETPMMQTVRWLFLGQGVDL